MTAESSLALCLLDCVPNLGFLIGGYFLVRLVRLTGRRFVTGLMAGGVAFVFAGGALQLTWKVVYTLLLLGDPRFLSDLQFVLLAPGFLMMLLSAILVLKTDRSRHLLVVAAMAPWKIPFLAVMTVCSLGLYGVLTLMSFRWRARMAGAMFVVAAITILAMARLAGGEQTVARQWTEESINSVGQLTFATGSYLLYRRRLRNVFTSG